MSSAVPKSISLPGTDLAQVQALKRMLQGGGLPALINPAGERMELPGAVIEVLKEAVGIISQGQRITLVAENRVVTTQRAAEMLGMSRPFLVKLLESGAMAYHRVGNQRRIAVSDLLAFARKRDEGRMAALDQLSRDAFESGLYERNRIPEGGVDA